MNVCNKCSTCAHVIAFGGAELLPKPHSREISRLVSERRRSKISGPGFAFALVVLCPNESAISRPVDNIRLRCLCTVCLRELGMLRQASLDFYVLCRY